VTTLPRIRSLLFSPTSFGPGVASDALVLDLQLPSTRETMVASVAQHRVPATSLFVCVNAVSSGLFEEDVRRVAIKGIAALILRKVDSREMLLEAIYRVREVARERDVNCPVIIPLIETPKGLLHAADIASCSSMVAGLCFGRDAFLGEMGIETELCNGLEACQLSLHARITVSLAARSAAVQSFDAPWVDDGNLSKLPVYIRESMLLGMSGMIATESMHVAAINEGFPIKHRK
jgi:citrate lyase beta subunit